MVQFFQELRAGRLQRSAGFSTPHLKAPSTKFQAPKKHQAPNSQLRTWSLGFGASLQLGAWSLVLSDQLRCSGKSSRMLSSFASQMTLSMISLVTNSRVDTSKQNYVVGQIFRAS